MSTCATYRFVDSNVTYYIHYDGYLEGAAIYFSKIVDDPIEKWSENFGKKNDTAEMTADHSAHDNTEYRYDIYTDGTVIVQCVHYDNFERLIWESVYCGSLKDFVDTYLYR